MTSLRDRVLAELAADPKTAHMAVSRYCNFAYDTQSITDDTAFLKALHDGIAKRRWIASDLQQDADDYLNEAAGLAAALMKVTGAGNQS